jgi:hypothetical protein
MKISALEPASVVFAYLLVAYILCGSTNPKVFPSIIATPAINMVSIHTLWGVHNQPMHEYHHLWFPGLSHRITMIKIPLPLIYVFKVCVINNGNPALS